MEQFGGLSHLLYQKLAQFVNRGSGMTTKQISNENVEKEKKPKLTQERVRELFDLDEERGVLTRKIARTNKAKVGTIAGSLSKSTGYLVIGIDGKLYLLHRVIFLYCHGYMPENDIDHIDKNKLNNAPSNLREISPRCNARNAKLSSRSTTGIKGIGWRKTTGRWTAQIRDGEDFIFLGFHDRLTEAVAHRLAAEQALDWSGCDSSSSAYQYMQAYVRGEDMQTYLKDLANK